MFKEMIGFYVVNPVVSSDEDKIERKEYDDD